MTDMLDRLCETSSRAARMASRYARMLETMPPGMSSETVETTLRMLSEQQCLVLDILHSALACLQAIRSGIPLPASAPPAGGHGGRPRLSLVSPSDGAA